MTALALIVNIFSKKGNIVRHLNTCYSKPDELNEENNKKSIEAKQLCVEGMDNTD